MKDSSFDVVIVGAGISGLAARRLLLSRGLSVCLIEKSRGLGGRVSSRRGEGWTADLGAQFMARIHPEWDSCLENLTLKEVRLPSRAEYPRWCHVEGMSRVARMIAGDTAGVMFETKVTNVSKLSSGWQVTVHSGALINSKALIITAPVPQALELLRASDIAIDSEILLTIERLTFRRCIAVVMRELDSFAASKKYSWPTLWKDPSVELDGIFDQKRKGISNSQNIVVVHTSKSLTEQLWSMEPDLIKRSVEQVVNPIVSSEQEKVQWEAIHLHKWRYSEPESIHPEKCLLIDVDGPLVLAGDAFGRSSVDGAFSSGHAAATLLLDKISNVIPLRDSP